MEVLVTFGNYLTLACAGAHRLIVSALLSLHQRGPALSFAGAIEQSQREMMNATMFFTIFATVFLAELGDKTQLATVLFASKEDANLVATFTAASLALVCSTGIAVALGSIVSTYMNPQYLSYAAGVGFIAIGMWTIAQA